MLTSDRQEDGQSPDAEPATHAADAAARPVTLPRVALRSGERAAWNALASHQDTPIGFGDLTVTFTFAALPDGRTQALVTRGTHGPLRVAITEFPVADLFGETFDAGQVSNLPDALREAVSRAMFTALADVLPGGLGSALTVDLVDGAAEQPQEVAASIKIEGAFSAPARFLIAGSPSALLAILGVGELAALARHPQLAASIPVQAALSLGSTDFTLTEVRDLSPGDIVICPVGARKDAIQLRLAGRIKPLTRSGAGWTIGAERMDDPTPPQGSAAPLSLQDLPVRLEFHLGDITLPLSAVETLTEQAVLPLDAVAIDGVPVTIRANGTTIAEGDLVQLDDRLGVRLTRVGVRAIETAVDAPPALRSDDAP